MYAEYLAAWDARTGGTMFMHFVHCDGWSVYGRWGAQEYQSQAAAPKLLALMAYIDAKP